MGWINTEVWNLLMGWLHSLFSLLAILLLAWLALRLVGAGQRRVLRRLEQSDDPESRDIGRRGRLQTMVDVFVHSIRVVIIVMALISLLSALGVNVTPLITSLGVLGLALSLGAQTLIKDYVFGLIILIENQYSVGETITVGAFTGQVERITMRATWLRDEQGRVTIIPHGDVRALTNASRDWGLADVSFNLPADADLPGAIHTLEEAARQAVEQERLQDALVTQPSVQGWSNSAEEGLRLRMCARTSVHRRQAVEAVFCRYGKQALQQGGFRLKE